MQEALTCNNYNCVIRSDKIHELHKDIIDICSKASKACLPHTAGSNSNSMKVVPGWNEHVKEHAENAKLWHDVAKWKA